MAYATLAPSHRTEGTIVSTMARSLGSSLGISILQAALIRDSAVAHTRLAERIAAGDPVVRAALPPLLDPSTPGGVELLNGEVSRQAAMIGYNAVFATMLVFTLLLIPLLLFMRAPRQRAPLMELVPD